MYKTWAEHDYIAVLKEVDGHCYYCGEPISEGYEFEPGDCDEAIQCQKCYDKDPIDQSDPVPQGYVRGQ